VTVEMQDPELRYLLVRRNERDQVWCRNGETFRLDRSDRIEIVDVTTNLPADLAQQVQVNFRGYVGRQGAEDRGEAVYVGRDLLPRFSVDGQGRRYAINVSHAGKIFGTVFIQVSAAGGSTAGETGTAGLSGVVGPTAGKRK